LQNTNAQDLTKGSGKEFYLTAFPQCPDPEPYGMPDSVIVYIVGTQACTGYAKNFATGYQLNFSVTPTQTTEIRIPATQAQCTETEGKQYKAIYINTTKDVWVYMQTSSRHCEGTLRTQALPTGTPTYMGPGGFISSSKVPISPVSHFTDEILVYPFCGAQATQTIIATEDSTWISLPIPGSFIRDTILLNRGEVYTYQLSYFAPEFGCVYGIRSINCKTIIGLQSLLEKDFSEFPTNCYLNIFTVQSNYSQFFSKEFLYLAQSPFVEFSQYKIYRGMFMPFSINLNIIYDTHGVPFGSFSNDLACYYTCWFEDWNEVSYP